MVVKRWGVALATLALGWIGASPARAQCTTCSPLSLPSASLVGADLEAARRADWAIAGQASSGWVAFPRQVVNGSPLQTFRPARFDLLLSTLQASALHRSGLGVDAVVPFGALLSREGEERREEFALGDVEVKPRATTLLGRSVRIAGAAGAALPTGGYTVRSGAGALGEASRALTIGRGVYWMVAEADVRWQAAAEWTLGLAAQARAPLGEARDKFRWGPEGRVSSEVEWRPLRPLGIALGGEVQRRTNGSIVDPFLGTRVPTDNVAATIVSVVPSVRTQLGSSVQAALHARIPVVQELDGLQFEQGLGIFASVGVTVPIAARDRSAKTEPSARTSPATAPETEAASGAVAAPYGIVLREYGAEWCEPCKRLWPLLERERARGVRVERVDVTEWSQDELLARVPGARALPILEILRPDGTLVRRLEGEEALSFSQHMESPR